MSPSQDRNPRVPVAAAAPTADLLEAVVAAARHNVGVRRLVRPLADVAKQAAGVEPRAGRFSEALRASGRLNVIAECKRRSPSRGVLCREYDPVRIARGYQRAGAAAISVLTEPSFFDGSLDHLAAISRAVDLPILRKDFIVDEYQLYEARAAGAHAALLIVAALDDGDLAALLGRTRDLELEALVEVHDEEDLVRALDHGARTIGVNQRNLRTLAMQSGVARSLIQRIPRDAVKVAESGLRTPGEVDALRRAGYNAFLIGEAFMTAEDPGTALGTLLESVRALEGRHSAPEGSQT